MNGDGENPSDGHLPFVCDGCDRGCMFCDGGLFGCRVCSSFEGATTSQCPGRRMSVEEADAVYAGLLDYRDGSWVDAPSPHSPNGRRRIREAIECDI